MRRVVAVLAFGAMLAACDGGGTTAIGDADAAGQQETALDALAEAAPEAEPDVAVEDEATAPDPEPEEMAPLDIAPEEAAPVDLPPEETTPIDVATDPAPEEVAPQDASSLSETAQACLYVVTNICAKMLPKCDFLGLIPQSWMDTCTQFLTANDTTVGMACSQLDNVQSEDPTVALIVSMGPSALQSCTDNFKCDLKAAEALYQFLAPLVSGGKVETAQILDLVVQLCFPQE
jgi:hypothetical protein